MSIDKVIMSRIQQFRRVLGEHFAEQLDILPAETILENAIAAGQLRNDDNWETAKELVLASGAGWGFPSFFDLYFEQIVDYATTIKFDLRTVQDLTVLIRKRNGQIS